MQITDADYTHAKRICKDFEIKDLGEYHDLHVQINALWGSEFLSYETELRKMTSHFEGNFSENSSFELLTPLHKILN